MQRIMLGLLTALAVVVLPSYLTAEEGKRPHRPRPEARPQGPNPKMMFKRLDANRDNLITARELPADMPERFKMLLIRADGNKDGELTLVELTKAVKVRRPGSKAKAGPVPPPSAKRPKAGGAKPPKMAARALFARLDKDKDGKLSLEEFTVGLRHLRQVFTARANAWRKPMQPRFGPEYAKKFFAKGPKPHDGRQFAKGPYRFCCMWHGMGPWQMRGMQFGMGPWQMHGMRQGMGPWQMRGMQFGMGPWHPHGMQFGMGPWQMRGMQPGMGPWQMRGMQPGMGPWQPHGMQPGMGPWQMHGMQPGMGPWQMLGAKQAWGQKRPDGKIFATKQWKPDGKKKEWAKDHKHPWAKKPKAEKPKAKKPAIKKPKGKVDAEKKFLEIEARLTALENQQAAMLVAIQEQQATMMAALQKTNKLVRAKLASLGREHDQARPQLDKARPKLKTKELAKAGKKAKHRQKPREDDRD